VVASLARAADPPETLVSVDEAGPIHSAVVRKEAWTQEPVRRLRAEAERYLKEGPWSVTTDRPKGTDPDPHAYYSEAPFYWPDPANPGGPFVRRNGQDNPSRFTANRMALESACDAVFTLGTAAYLLDDARYAQHAARIVQAWFIAPKTRMDPSMEYAGVVPGAKPGEPLGLGGGVSEGRPLIRAIQGMEFLGQSGEWDPRDAAATHKWFEEYLRWLTPAAPAVAGGRRSPDNSTWRTALEAAAASFAGDAASRQAAFDAYRARTLPRLPRAGGSAPPPAPGSAPQMASQVQEPALAASLEARATLCRIAQVQGVDLWSLHARGGATIAGSIDALNAGLMDPKRWSKEQAAAFQSSGVYLLAFAGMGLNNPEYAALYRKWERPEGSWLALVDLLVGRWEAAAHQTRH